jgi:hypothetical protein
MGFGNFRQCVEGDERNEGEKREGKGILGSGDKMRERVDGREGKGRGEMTAIA